MTAHALPEVTAAVAEQAGKIIHTSTLYLNRPMVELAEEIAAVSGIPDAKVFFTTSGTEANDAALLLAVVAAPVQPDPRAAQQLPRPVVLHDRDHRQPDLVADVAVAVPDLLRARRQPLPQPVRRAGGRRVRRRRAWRTCARCSTRRGGDVACLIAEPIQGVGGFTARARRAARRLREGAGRARHPVDQRRGADRLGPHRRALLGLAGARPGRRDPGHRHVRQGHRERAVGGRRHRPRRDHGQPARQLDLDVRRLADHGGRGAGQPAVPARARPAGQRREGRPDPARRAARAGARRSSATCAARA